MDFDHEALSKKTTRDLDDLARQNIRDRFLLRAIFDILIQRDRRTAKETCDWILRELQRKPRVQPAGMGSWLFRPLMIFIVLLAAAVAFALALAVQAGIIELAWPLSQLSGRS